MKKLVFILIGIFCAITAFAQLTGADEIPTTVIHKTPVDDDHKMKNGTNFRNYGPTVTRGIGKFFGVKLNYDGSTNREADLRFALYNMNKEIVELYKPMRITVLAGGINGYLIPCMVNAPAGDYYVVPLFRWAGETDWTATLYSIFHPDNEWRDFSLWQWKFTVIEDRLPLVNYVRLPDGLYTPKQGQKFDLTVKFSNPYSVTKSGRIKIIHERDIKKFNPGYSYSSEQSNDEFWDCMTTFASMDGAKADKDGSFSISINSSSSKVVTFTNVVSYENHGEYDQFAGQLNCYYLPDGLADIPENWVMLQEDCSSLFVGSNLVYTEDNDEYVTASTRIDTECKNYQGFILIPDPTSVEDIDLPSVSLSYNRINQTLNLLNIPNPCAVTIYSICGVEMYRAYGSMEGVSLNIGDLPFGIYIIRLSNYDGTLVKSFKITR